MITKMLINVYEFENKQANYYSLINFFSRFSFISLVRHGEIFLNCLLKRSANVSGGRLLKILQKEITLKRTEDCVSLQLIKNCSLICILANIMYTSYFGF
jgi:hypothetical protein